MSVTTRLRAVVILLLAGCAGTSEAEPQAASVAQELAAAHKQRQHADLPNLLLTGVAYEVVDLDGKRLGFAYAGRVDEKIQKQVWIIDDLPAGRALRGPFKLLKRNKKLTFEDDNGQTVTVENLTLFDEFARRRFDDLERPRANTARDPDVSTRSGPVYIRVVAQASANIPSSLPAAPAGYADYLLNPDDLPLPEVGPGKIRQLDDGTVGIFRDKLTLAGIASSAWLNQNAIERFFLAPTYRAEELGSMRFLELSDAPFHGQDSQAPTLTVLAERKWFLVTASARKWSSGPLPSP